MKTAHAMIAIVGMSVTQPSFADCDLSNRDLRSLVGYTLTEIKTVERWYNESDRQADDGWEGCDFGRTIIFTDGTAAECRTYHYSYAYRPEAYIFFNRSGSLKICIEDELMDFAP